ncbi:MAG: hypothetical protein C4308_14840, partial [Chitinophagaceae bacterium]
LGITRSGTTPTIGAYENAGEFTPPSITYTTLTNTCNTSNRSFTGVIITDASGVNTSPGTKPRVYYKRSTDANTFVDNTSGTNGWKYAEANGTTSPFDFTIDYSLLNGGTGVTVGDVIQYFVVAQDLAPTPNIGINSGTFNAAPSSVALTSGAFPIGGTINSYTIGAYLSGTYTVGSGGNYGTLTNAVAAYNAACLTGPVVFSLIDANYNVGETFPIVINSNSYASITNTLTIKPASGVTATITGSVPSDALIKLNGADYVTIDGSNNGTTSRNLTISNTTTGTSTAVIWVSSASASDGATNNTIKNTIISGNSATTTGYGIISGGASIPSSALTANSNNVIQNNRISKVQFGINWAGTSTSVLDAGTQIISNVLGSSTPGDGFGILGIQTQFQDGIIIRGNEIQNIVVASGDQNYSGISLIDTRNASVENNKIHGMSYTGATTGKLFGILTISSFNTAGSPSNNLFANNVVYDMTSTSISGFWSLSGIDDDGGYGDKFYFNTVYLAGSLSGSSLAPAACFANGNTFFGSPATNIDVRNNIFFMKGSASVAVPLYAHFTIATSYAGSTLNYNDLYTDVSGSAIANIGGINSTDYTTLGTWQAASGEGANSVSVDPVFTSSTNFALQATSPVISAGVTGTGITTDITGSGRNNPPSMGAYESKIVVSVKVWLQGAYNSGLSRHKDVSATWASVLNANALTQPYNTAAFGNYAGTESVASGFFTSTGATTDIVDWVLVELRDANTPTTIVTRRAAFIREDGMIVDLDGVSPVAFKGMTSGNYFIAIRHRNHLGIRTASVQLVNGSESPVAYDFTTAQSQAYQNTGITTNAAMKDLGGVFGMWGGNANQNTSIRASGGPTINDYLFLVNTVLGGDIELILNNVYNSADINMDGIVRASGGGPSINDYLFLVNTILNGDISIILNQHL